VSATAASILVVDDDDAGRYAKSRILRGAGYAITEAARGHAAIESVMAKPPDLVLLDVRLPDIDGISVCRQIKASFPQIIVLQTSAAFISAAHRAQALEGGADSYLIEPIDPSELVGIVRALLRMRTAEQELRGLNDTLEARVAERTHELAEANRRLAAEQEHHRRTQEVLWHTQKLEAVGQLTGGVAHDFNNLLTVITGNLELIQATIEHGHQLPLERLSKLIGTAQNAAHHGAQITRQLLAFGRRSTLRAETVDLNSFLSASEDFLRRALGEAIELDLAYAPDLWPCWADPVQFEAAILNLVVNARDAMARGGRLRIETDNVEIDRATAENAGGPVPGSYVRIRVSDNGIGMDAETAMRAFEPFFTTKEVGRGSGLGLSQVYGFINQSGGHVDVDSAPGEGASFSLYLPRSEAGARSYRADAPSVEIPSGRERILVVEDNDEVLEVAVTIIRDLGYEVLIATDGDEALALLGRDPSIDLLFSDVVMPGGLSGFQLAEMARAVNADLQVLLTSGYPARGGGNASANRFPLIMKPYRREQLARMLRAALDRRVPAPAVAGLRSQT
jgi:signal transduction histidine kinase